MTGVFSLAVHALVYLNHKRTSVSSEELAGNICTNPARVRKVIALLKRAGLVSTREGSLGGCTFICDPAEVTLRRVAQAVDARFVAAGWRSGGEDKDCLIASGMAAVMDDIYAGLDGRCLEQLEHITILDIDRRIFGAKGRPRSAEL